MQFLFIFATKQTYRFKLVRIIVTMLTTFSKSIISYTTFITANIDVNAFINKLLAVPQPLFKSKFLKCKSCEGALLIRILNYIRGHYHY